MSEELSFIPPAEKQYRDYIKGLLPEFEAPVDPSLWSEEACKLRRRVLNEVFLRGFDRDIIKARPRVVRTGTLRPDAPYVIRKLRYEAYPGYWIPSLLYEPVDIKDKAAVVLNANGHHCGGKAAVYKQARCANLARRGLIALSFEFIGMSELGGDTHDKLPYLDFTGLSAAGFFYMAMRKGLDVLLDVPNADPTRVAMTGLSGGGWQTIVLSALDPRITLSVPVAGYTAVRSRVDFAADIGDFEQCPPDLTTVLDYDTLTAMLAPRPALIISNEKDESCFRTERVKPVIYDAVRPVYQAMGAGERFAFYSNRDPGTHNYERDNRRRFYRFLMEHFGMSGPDDDIHCEHELYPETLLSVGLPLSQETFFSICLRRARRLAGRASAPASSAARVAMRSRLAAALRLPRFELAAAPAGGKETAALFCFKTGPWSLPALRISGADDLPPLLCIPERGVESYLNFTESEGGIVPVRWVVDILGTGRSRCRWVWQQLINTVGQRFLGVQAAQIIAVARWLAREAPCGKISVDAGGIANSVAALTAGALEPFLFDRITLGSCPPSFVQVVQRWLPVDESLQPVLCPGLMEVVDIPQLTDMLEGVELCRTDRFTL